MYICIHANAYVLIYSTTFSVEIPQQPKSTGTASKTEADAGLPGQVHREHEHKDCPPEFWKKIWPVPWMGK